MNNNEGLSREDRRHLSADLQRFPAALDWSPNDLIDILKRTDATIRQLEAERDDLQQRNHRQAVRIEMQSASLNAEYQSADRRYDAIQALRKQLAEAKREVERLKGEYRETLDDFREMRERWETSDALIERLTEDCDGRILELSATTFEQSGTIAQLHQEVERLKGERDEANHFARLLARKNLHDTEWFERKLVDVRDERDELSDESTILRTCVEQYAKRSNWASITDTGPLKDRRVWWIGSDYVSAQNGYDLAEASLQLPSTAEASTTEDV